MDDSSLEAVCFFVPCLVGLGIYLLFDAIRNHNRRRMAAMEDPDSKAPATNADGAYQLNYSSPPKHRRPMIPRPSTKAVGRAVIILALWGGLIAMVESYQHRTRHVVLTFVDAVTGKPIPLVVSYEAFYEAQMGDYDHPRFGPERVDQNVVYYEWNCPTSVTVTQAGYQPAEIELEWDETPKLIKLCPATTPPPVNAGSSPAANPATRSAR